MNNNNTFCILPWISLFVLPNGNVQHCCISNWNYSLGNVNTHTFEELFNSSVSNEIRRQLIAGEKSLNCTYCYEKERVANYSLRLTSNVNWKDIIDVRDITNSDGSISDPKLMSIDIKYSNFCNFKCVMCAPHCSSSWVNDAISLNQIPMNPSGGLVAIDSYSLFHKQLGDSLCDLHRIRFEGGESLLIKDQYRVLDKLCELGRYDIKLEYNTNFSKFLKYPLFETWKKFKNLKVDISIDGLHARGEYIRKGLDYKTWVSNVEKLCKIVSPKNYTFHGNVNVLNAWHVPDMVLEMFNMGFLDGTYIDFDVLTRPDYLKCQILPSDFKAKLIVKYDEVIGKIASANLDTASALMVVRDSLFSLNMYNTHKDEFLDYIHSLDKIRNQNYLDVFPELIGVFDNNYE